MGDYSGLPLWSDFTPGALLPLTVAPRTSGHHVFQDGVEVEIRKQVRAVVVRNVPASTFDDLLAPAVDRANRALDLLCISGIAAARVGDIEDFRVEWCSQDGEAIVRLYTLLAMQFRGAAGGFVTDSDGNMVFAPTSPNWADSLRYFRLSQSTDDLFDAFRNLYLALESILSTIEPRQRLPGGRWEGEGVWLERALAAAGARVNISSFLAKSSPNPARALYRELWEKVRNQVFHAKAGQPSFLPLDAASRPVVKDSLIRFGRLFVELAEKSIGTRFLGSGLGVAAFDGIAAVLDDYRLVLTDDDTPFSPHEQAISPAGRPLIQLQSERAHEFDAPYRTAVKGRIAATEVTSKLAHIARLVAADNDAPASAQVLDGRLRLDGADAIEAVFIVEASGVSVRETYPS